ncbi:MAG: hypothetical protein OXD32_04525 [Endozoicomonadaceae bacterium]|nr:hypothetical protein [Endozoicomonadaceae bacterium]
MDTANEIKKSLEKMQARFSNSKWTATEANKFIKSELGEKFSEKGFSINSSVEIKRSNSENKSEREWLYDFIARIWEDGFFKGVELAAEFELSSNCWHGIKRDYCKLLQSDANNKLFIFIPPPPQKKKIIKIIMNK